MAMSAARYARLRGDRAVFMTAYKAFCCEHSLEDVGVESEWAAALRGSHPDGPRALVFVGELSASRSRRAAANGPHRVHACAPPFTMQHSVVVGVLCHTEML